MSDYDDYDNEDSSSFGDEFAARERTSVGLFGDPSEFSFDPKDKFTKKVYSQVSALISEKYLSQTDKETIIQEISNLSHVEMRNATGFVFGFIASNGGSGVTKESWKRAYKIYASIKDSGGGASLWDDKITQVDIVRYGRFWVSSVLHA